MFNKNILSIDIGNKNIKLVEAKNEYDNITINKAITIETPENCFNDGEIQDVNMLKKEIAKVLKENKIKAKQVVCTSESTSLITRIIEVPLAKGKELDALVNYEIQQYFPVNSENHIIKYSEIEEYEKDFVNICKVRVVVYPKAMAKGYWELVRGLKLTPVALDVSSNCITKLFNHNDGGIINRENYSLDKTVVVIDLGYDYLQLNIISNGVLEFTRTTSGGGSYLDANIASQIYLKEKEAEEKKINLCDLEEDDNSSNTEAEIINNSIKMVVNRWVREIDKMIEYYKNKNKDKIIYGIYLHGGTSNLKGIEKYMQFMLNMPVSKIKTMSCILSNSLDIENDLERYLNAIGATIRL